MTKENKPNLSGVRKAQVLELATAQLPTITGHLKDIKVDNDIDAAAYIATLPEGLTSDVAAAIHRHDTVFLAASGKATQDAAVEFMAKKANKEVERMTAIFDMTGGMNVTHTVNRSTERREMINAAGEVISPANTVYGSTVSRVRLPVTGAKEMLSQSLEANAKLLG